ncbi:hypothetical protein [Mitsuokella sp.]|nr:hypothetical protein [Mitsuokella sp.]MDD6383001.1 hypothetical protein [Selenomonadaceae bacterium]MDY4475124.1 hypothetical protein [Mitsuokella sp.]
MKISFTRQTIYTYYKSRDEVLLMTSAFHFKGDGDEKTVNP